MKQTIVLMAILCIAGMISWQQKTNEVKSLADVIREDPGRRQEMRELFKAWERSEHTRLTEGLDPEDELNDQELEQFRQAGGVDDPTDKVFPTLRVATSDLLAIIGPHSEPGDSLVFYKGKYSKGDTRRLERYNKKFAHGQDVYTYDMLKHRKTFVIRLESGNASAMVLHYRNPAYDIVRLCPPPRTGCD